MPSSSSSSPLRPLLLLPLLLSLLLLQLRPGGAAEDCSASFRSGQDDFVLDTEDSVKEGAAPLSTAHVQTPEECRSACCSELRCNLALLKPLGSKENRTCVLFSCVHRGRFVCRFVNQAGYQSYIRETVFQKYLAGPGVQAPPIAFASSDVIIQPSKTVTLNGSESLALNGARITDYSWSLQSGNGSYTMETTDLPDQVKLSNMGPGFYTFQLTVTDSNDQSDSTNLKVLVLDEKMSSLFCRADMKVGPCRAAFPRWRYDAATGSCKQFVFGGCKPNKNNYLSEKECVWACGGVIATAERSVTPPATEECDSACRPDQMICDNGCCLDRRLECDGVKHCSDGSDEDHCSKLNQTFNRLLDIDVNERKAQCTEPPHTGPCRASFTRWYYNPLHKKCFTFTYGGCDGNKNNFEDDQKCSETCKGVNEEHVFSRGLFDRFEKEDESDSGSIALAVVLSVAILALLAILTYCFLKARRKRTHRPVATGPAHVALSEQDTLVYNSTTKPV